MRFIVLHKLNTYACNAEEVKGDMLRLQPGFISGITSVSMMGHVGSRIDCGGVAYEVWENEATVCRLAGITDVNSADEPA